MAVGAVVEVANHGRHPVKLSIAGQGVWVGEEVAPALADELAEEQRLGLGRGEAEEDLEVDVLIERLGRRRRAGSALAAGGGSHGARGLLARCWRRGTTRERGEEGYRSQLPGVSGAGVTR